VKSPSIKRGGVVSGTDGLVIRRKSAQRNSVQHADRSFSTRISALIGVAASGQHPAPAWVARIIRAGSIPFASVMRPDLMSTIDTPFRGGSAVVKPEWIDHNGHMNVGYYHVVFDASLGPFFQFIGLNNEIRKQYGGSSFALESHLTYVHEVKLGDPLRFEVRLLDFDAKRFHYFMEMYHAEHGWLAATNECLSVWVDMTTRRTAPMPDVMQQRMTEVLAAHASLPRPWQIGHVISARPRKG
jgi:acyl-CoA thioester hydrolase